MVYLANSWTVLTGFASCIWRKFHKIWLKMIFSLKIGIWEIMASEAHNVRKQKVLHIEGCLVDLPRKRISSSTRKIMKEVRFLSCPLLETEVNVQTEVHSSKQSKTGYVVLMFHVCMCSRTWTAIVIKNMHYNTCSDCTDMYPPHEE